MLVTFKCKGYSSITLFGNIAEELLRLMHHSGTIPGALAVEDVSSVLSFLKEAVEPLAIPPADGKISLRQRALPLLELLQYAVKEELPVLWDYY